MMSYLGAKARLINVINIAQFLKKILINRLFYFWLCWVLVAVWAFL